VGRTRNLSVLLLIGFATLVGFVVVAVVVIALDRETDPFDNQQFDPAVWAAGDHEVRMAMARDAARRTPAGMSEAEVVNLLGKPDTVEESRRLTASAPARAVQTYSYYLGSSHLSSLRGLDDAFLWVHLGNDGRVVAAVIGGG
jgi:hypothetical protein